jgi:hypothetical protein
LAAKAVQQMDLDAAAEARLRELADTDRMVKETMLPYEERLANAQIGATMAQAGYYAARAERDTEDTTAAALFENFQGKSYGEMKSVLKPHGINGGVPVEQTGGEATAPQRNFSFEGFNSNIGETPSGPLSSFAEEPDDLFGSLGVTREELTNPKYALASTPQGVSTDVPPNNEAMQVLEKREADKTAPTSSLLSEQQSEDLKGIRSGLYKDSNPLLNMPEIQAREAKEKQGSLGGFITNEYSFLQEQENLTALLSKKNPERVARGAAVEYMKGQFNSEAAKKFGISPAAVPMLVYSSRGVLRSSEEIDQIHGAMKQGYVDLPDDKGQMLRYEVKSPEDAVALTEKQRMTPINRAAGGGVDLKQLQDRQVAMKNFFEIRKAANENPEDKTLQATYQLSLSDMKSVYGDEWDRVKFGLNQQDFGNALKFQGQKVDLKGKPVEGLNAKTADQSRLEMIQSGLIPSIKILSKDGKLKVDESELNKIPDGAYFAGIDENNAVGEFRKENGKPVALSKPAPSNEETPLDARIKEIEAKEAVANAGSNKKRIQEIDREISALSAPITQRRESSFSPMGYSAPVSSRALNKNELIRNRNRILELKKLKASLQK